MNKTFKDLLPQPHWSKAKFKAHDIPISVVAKALGLSYSYVSSLLSGVCNVTEEVEGKLKGLVERMERSKSAPEEGE